jgi:uncharacterized protein
LIQVNASPLRWPDTARVEIDMDTREPSAPSRQPAGLAQRAPVAVFLAITFAWAWSLWGYWLFAMPPGGIVITPAFMVTAIVGGLAPSSAAIVTAWMLSGRAGVSSLLGGVLNWRASPLWYLLALAIVPLASLISALLQSAFIGPLKPVDPALIAVAAIWPLMAALGEEFGWRGFLFPRLLQRFGYIGAALVIGIIWGLWHLPADYVGLKGMGEWFWLAFLLNGPVVLTAHALIMAFISKRSGGNLLLMILYHWSITASAMLFPAAGSDSLSSLAATGLGCMVLWLIAIVLWAIETRRP